MTATHRRIPQRYEPAVPLDTLTEHPANPRRGRLPAIRESMEHHGFVGAVYVQESTRRIVAGNHRARTARALGLAAVPVLWLGLDDDQALRVLLVDNRASDQGTYDEELLLSALEDLDGLAGTCYDPADLAELRAVLDGLGEHEYGPPDMDALAPHIRLTVPSDVWVAWSALLAAQPGEDDLARLAAHLDEVGVMSPWR
jgi:ParB family chromosome partitioning protein